MHCTALLVAITCGSSGCFEVSKNSLLITRKGTTGRGVFTPRSCQAFSSSSREGRTDSLRFLESLSRLFSNILLSSPTLPKGRVMAHHPDLGPGPGGYKEEPAPVAGDPVSTVSIHPYPLYHQSQFLFLFSEHSCISYRPHTSNNCCGICLLPAVAAASPSHHHFFLE